MRSFVEYIWINNNIRGNIHEKDSRICTRVSRRYFALYKGHAGNYTDVTVLGTYPMKDKYGNVTDSVIFAITLTKDTINKTTFENLTPTTDLIPLSSSHAIRPELIN